VKIINVARGGIVDEAALLRALNVSIIMVFINYYFNFAIGVNIWLNK